jgi:hypothetical protein
LSLLRRSRTSAAIADRSAEAPANSGHRRTTTTLADRCCLAAPARSGSRRGRLYRRVLGTPFQNFQLRRTTATIASGAPLARRGGQVAVADASAKIWLSSASESYAFRFPLTLGSSRRAYGGRKTPGNALRIRFLYEKSHFSLFQEVCGPMLVHPRKQRCTPVRPETTMCHSMVYVSRSVLPCSLHLLLWVAGRVHPLCFEPLFSGQFLLGHPFAGPPHINAIFPPDVL